MQGADERIVFFFQSARCDALTIFLLRALVVSLILTFVIVNPGLSQAKPSDEQAEIILLNDSAAALEDSNPELSRRLTRFADEKEKEWEKNNANKNQDPSAMTTKDTLQVQEKIKLIKAAQLAIEPAYPLIAKALKKMAKDLNRTITDDK